MNQAQLVEQLKSDPEALHNVLSDACRVYVLERDAVQLKIDNIKIVMHQASTILARERQTAKEIAEIGEALRDDDLLSLPTRLVCRLDKQ